MYVAGSSFGPGSNVVERGIYREGRSSGFILSKVRGINEFTATANASGKESSLELSTLWKTQSFLDQSRNDG